MYRPSRSHPRIELDLAKRAFVARYILLQKSQQSLGLLRAQVDSLKITDLNVCLALLLQRAEDKKKVPYIDPHLHAVRIALAVVRIIR